MSDERFAGLPPRAGIPADLMAASSGSPPDTAHEFTLPSKCVGRRWDMEDKYLKFWLDEITPKMQNQAAKLAKNDAARLQQELIFQSICWIGDRNVSKDRDFVSTWWTAIGSKARVMVTSAFAKISAPDEAELAMFLGEPIEPDTGAAEPEDD